MRRLSRRPRGWPWPRAAAADAPKTVAALIGRPAEAYERGDKAGFLRDYEEPRGCGRDTLVLYNLACAQALQRPDRRRVATLRGLCRATRRGRPRRDTDFDSMRSADGYKEIVAGDGDPARRSAITSGAVVAFTIPEKEIAAEGVAYDPVTKAFFVASVRKGKIFRIGAGRKVSDFVAAGRRICAARSAWAWTPKPPHALGRERGDPAHEWREGRRSARRAPSSSSTWIRASCARSHRSRRPPKEPPYFDDLTVARGRARLRQRRRSTPASTSSSRRRRARGVRSSPTPSTGARRASPSRPTARRSTSPTTAACTASTSPRGHVVPLPVPPDVSLSGVDGLVYADGRLVAIQNGVAAEPRERLRARARRLHDRARPDSRDEPSRLRRADARHRRGRRPVFLGEQSGAPLLRREEPPRPEDLQDAVILRVPVR